MTAKSRKVEQGNATRNALLLAARSLFGRQGYAETSLNEIVRTAGVTKGAFYHHFSSKEAVFRQVFEAVKRELSRNAFVIHAHDDTRISPDARQYGRAQLRVIADQDDDEVWHELLVLCRRYIELHTDPQVHRIVLHDARAVLTWDDWHRIENEYGVVMLRADLRRAMHRGIIKPLPLNALAMILTGALNDACMLVANAEDYAAAFEDVSSIIEHFLEGLRS